jgi:hypothetical protein
MSYLNVPRLHFAGRFQADPSTVNNNDNNWDPTAVFTTDPPDRAGENNSIYWNPNGTHNWKIVDCTVRGAVGPGGPVDDAACDPVIGAPVVNAGSYPAKLVDLDPDNQSVSQIWGLKVQIKIPDPSDATKVLASVTGTLPATAFTDLWRRTSSAPPGAGLSVLSAAFQGVLENIQWVNAAASGLLAKLQQVSPGALSIRFNVDSYQADSNQANFTYGRLVGTIGPVVAGDAPRSTRRRLVQSGATYGSAGAVWDKERSVLIVDLGNSLPAKGAPQPASGPSVPVAGWPISSGTLQLHLGGQPLSAVAPVSVQRLKTGFLPEAAPEDGPPKGTVAYNAQTYLNWAGIVEFPVPADEWDERGLTPLSLVDLATAQTAVEEDEEGRYVDVDLQFFRLDPGDKAPATLWATKFGQPWKTTLDLAVQPPGQVNNPGPQGAPETYAMWLGGTPEGVVTLSWGTQEGVSINVDTSSDGTATVTLKAGDPRIPESPGSTVLVSPRRYSDGQEGPDGQVYTITGSWQSWGGIFLYAAPLNVLVFNGYPLPEQPTWTAHVQPIFNMYARLYPYMKGIIDLGDYDTVKENAGDILAVLKLPRSNPHHMPIVRDLSRDKLAMIKQWFANGLPK